MFVHLAVPVTSSSAFPSGPTSTFCDFYATQYCCDFANYERSIDTFATQTQTKKVYVLFYVEYPTFSLNLRERLGKFMGEFFTCGSHIVYITDLSNMRLN